VNIRRLVLGLVPSLCVLATCASVLSAPALAKEVHVYKSTFGSEGSEPGQFKEPLGIAVNDTTHEVYVADTGNNRVERFALNTVTGVYEYVGQFNGAGAPTGVFSRSTGVAVDDSGDPMADPSAGDVYVVDHNHNVVDKFSATGTYIGQILGTPTSNPNEMVQAVAVDPNGRVWVSQHVNTEFYIDSYSDALTNELLTSHTSGLAAEQLAVDAEDDLYVENGDEIDKLNSSDEVLLGGQVVNGKNGVQDLSPFGNENVLNNTSPYFAQSGVAVDPTTREVYVGRSTGNEPVEGTIGAFTLGGTAIERFGSGYFQPPSEQGDAIHSVAVDSSDGMVYVTDPNNRVVVFEGVTLPTVSLQPLTEQTTRSVTLNGLVSPVGKPVTSCVFEYSTAEEYETTKAYGHSGSCEPAPGGGTGTVPVKAEIKGLTPETAYHYRLVADNAGGESATPDQELLVGPALGGESVQDVASTSATLEAPINPNGADTNYYLEYGTTTAYGSYAPVFPPGVDLGAAVGSQTVSVHLQELLPSTTYHYHFVAVQDGESFETPDKSFTTQSVGGASGEAGLPDGRVWEMVSPPDSNGASIELFENGDGQIQAASNGSGIVYPTEGPSVGENPAGNLQFTQVLSRRGPKGWSTENLALPHQLPENEETSESLFDEQPEYHLFSPDLSLAVAEPPEGGAAPLASGVKERTLYLRDDLNGSFLPLVTPENVPSETRIEEPFFYGSTGLEDVFEMHFVAATPDLSHVVFKTPMALTPEAFDEETVQKDREQNGREVPWNLYEWAGGRLQLVNILPDGEVVHGPKSALESPVRPASMGTSGGTPEGGAPRILSSNGARVAWTWGDPYNGGDYKGLYVRDMVEEKTVQVGGPGALYQTMNSEGSKIFYLENDDLYIYDFETGMSRDLTEAHGAGGTGGGVQEVISDVSENGSYVYFVATGVLASGGVAGQDNLYVLHDTDESWTTSYIATLSPDDKPDWYPHASSGGPGLQDLSSRVSPDGRYFEFMSERPLTGYDNVDVVSGQPDEEVFLYDAQSGKLVCASCDPTGARPEGVFDTDGSPVPLLVDRIHAWTGADANVANHWLAGSVPSWDTLVFDPATYQPRYLSDSGRLFFNSPVGLVPQDTNGLEDVYEYEPVGVGNCTEAAATGEDVYVPSEDGCVGLISSGTSSSESAFYDASENGDDVFFTTTGRLSPKDHDNGYDVYDAHVCTSEVPCEPVPVSAPPCNSGDSCKAAPSPQPAIFGPPPSATFNGAGNVTPASTASTSKQTTKRVRCKKGRKVSRGKCVMSKKAKVKKTRKASNDQGARS
jgi:sugar lactone lactonase YvrE